MKKVLLVLSGICIGAMICCSEGSNNVTASQNNQESNMEVVEKLEFSDGTLFKIKDTAPGTGDNRYIYIAVGNNSSYPISVSVPK